MSLDILSSFNSNVNRVRNYETSKKQKKNSKHLFDIISQIQNTESDFQLEGHIPSSKVSRLPFGGYTDDFIIR